MKILCLLMLAASSAIVLGRHHKLSAHTNPKKDGPEYKCGCCPEPCCCKCVNVSVTPGDCRMELDLMWILDSSGSINGSEWERLKEFVKAVTMQLSNVGTDQKVGLVCYGDFRSSLPLVSWCFNDPRTDNIDDFKHYVDLLAQKAGRTNTVDGIEEALICLQSPQDRPGVPNVCVLITDGETNERQGELPGAVSDLHMECDCVIVVGITDSVNQTELELIANQKQDKVIDVDDFAKLNATLDEVMEQICDDPVFEEECFCCCPPPPAVRPHYYGYNSYGYSYPSQYHHPCPCSHKDHYPH